jgi:phage gp46-like protein
MPSYNGAPDVRLVQNTQFPKYFVTLDWSLLPNGQLDDSQALATAICVALGTNAEALPTDALPDPDSTDRCGWWGDLDAELIWNGWPIGSKLWLLRRAKINSASSRTGSTLTLVENYIRAAVQPFVDLKICSSFAISVTRVDVQRVDALLRIYRGPLPAIDLQYQILWDAMGS